MVEKLPRKRKDTSKRPRMLGVRDDVLFSHVAPFYDLSREVEFDILFDFLFGLSCRDQEGEPTDPLPDPKVMTARRAEGYRLATVMKTRAATILSQLNEVHSAWLSFTDEVVRWNPSLLEAVLETNVGDPQNLFIPDEISILETFFDFDWTTASAKLGNMAALPVRHKLGRGPVPNVVLRQAIGKCREYWKIIEHKRWSMSSLKNRETRQEEPILDLLQGECETFVAEIIRRAGIRYDFKTLATAWTEVDAAVSEGARPEDQAEVCRASPD